MESPATRSAKWSAFPDTNECGTVMCSSTCSSARIGVPAAMRPSSGITAPSTFGSDSAIARGLVASFVSNPLRSRLASCAWTLEDEVRPTASPISRTVGG